MVRGWLARTGSLLWEQWIAQPDGAIQLGERITDYAAIFPTSSKKEMVRPGLLPDSPHIVSRAVLLDACLLLWSWAQLCLGTTARLLRSWAWKW